MVAEGTLSLLGNGEGRELGSSATAQGLLSTQRIT